MLDRSNSNDVKECSPSKLVFKNLAHREGRNFWPFLYGLNLIRERSQITSPQLAVGGVRQNFANSDWREREVQPTLTSAAAPKRSMIKREHFCFVFLHNIGVKKLQKSFLYLLSKVLRDGRRVRYVKFCFRSCRSPVNHLQAPFHFAKL